jgi:hypothetical protein
MNINSILLETIEYHGFEYSCYLWEIQPFLEGQLRFENRRGVGEKIIGDILREHGKQELIGCLAELAKIETGFRELEPYARDHVVHALLTFILGIYINERFIKGNTHEGTMPSAFQWKLAGLLHDIGYPIEISMKVMKPFVATVNRLRGDLGETRPVRFGILPDNLTQLSNQKDGLDLIQQQLTAWKLQIDARSEYASMIKSGIICHGMISSLAVLNVIDALYQKNNPRRRFETMVSEKDQLDWNQTFFEKDIVPACSAIFVHNLGLNSFRKSKITLETAPLPFLLVLADSLQEWERPSFENPTGFPSDLFDIQISDNKLHFFANIPEKRKVRIRESLAGILEANNVFLE